MMSYLALFLIGVAYVDGAILVAGGTAMAVGMIFNMRWTNGLSFEQIGPPMFIMVLMHFCAAVLVFIVSWLLTGVLQP